MALMLMLLINMGIPLHTALSWNRDDIVLGLLNAGSANIHTANNHGETPLHIAAKHADHRITLQLINDDENINAADCDGNTPLHFAVFYGDTNLVEILLNNGANSNAMNTDGRIPLHLAVLRTFQKQMV